MSMLMLCMQHAPLITVATHYDCNLEHYLCLVVNDVGMPCPVLASALHSPAWLFAAMLSQAVHFPLHPCP
jgi:hypothetical protein